MANLKLYEERWGPPTLIEPTLPAGVDKPWTGPERVKEIHAVFDREEKEQRKVYKRDELPHDYSLITPEWLTDCIAGDKHPDAKVVSWSSAEPDNGTSNRLHITMEWNEAGKQAKLPKSAFCKATTAIENRLNMSYIGGGYGENVFYNHIRPQITFNAPTAMFSNSDSASCKSITLCDDLSGKVRFLDYRYTPDEAFVRKQLALLAQMHGQFWGTKDPAIQSLPTYSQGIAGQWFATRAATYNMYGFKCSEDLMPERLYKQYDDIWPATLVSVSLNARAPHTLVHCDLHLGNWGLLENGEVLLFDWQCVCRGSWARDVAYLLASATATEFRRQHEDDWLRFYLDKLHEAGGPQIPIDEAWSAVSEQVLGALMYWLHVLTPDPGGMPEMMQPKEITKENIKRLLYMMDDHDTIGTLRRANGGDLVNR